MAWEENSRICLHMQLIAFLSRIGVITIFAIHYITELSHVGELRDVREVKGQMSCVLRQKAIVP